MVLLKNALYGHKVNIMVKLAKLLLSTKNLPDMKGTKFKVIGSGITANPDGVDQKFLDLETITKDGEKPQEFRFLINWTNEKHLVELGVDDTDYITSIILVEGKAEYMGKETTGVRIKSIEISPNL